VSTVIDELRASLKALPDEVVARLAAEAPGFAAADVERVEAPVAPFAPPEWAPLFGSAPAALPLPEPLPAGDEFDPARLHREFAEAAAGVPAGEEAEREWMELHRQFAEAAGGADLEFDPAELHRQFAEAAGLPESPLLDRPEAAALAEGAAPFEPPETEDVSPALAGGPEPSPWAGPAGEDEETFARAEGAGTGGGPLERIADAVDEILELLREGRREQAGGAEAAAPGPWAAPGRAAPEEGWRPLGPQPAAPRAPRDARPFPPPPFGEGGE
jgi:hypothetical protein